MSKLKKQYACSTCGAISYKWLGQCIDCQSWGTVNEEAIADTYTNNSLQGNILALENLDNTYSESTRVATPINEFNRVLGGGIVAGSVVLIGGEPGIGKSTLLLQLAAQLPSIDMNSLYVTAEESVNQIKLRAFRLGVSKSRARVISTTSVQDILATVEKYDDVNVIIIDSIQTIYTRELSSAPGTVSQIKATAHTLISYAKRKNITLILVGHVTKDGQLAGPKLLEHLVDTVLYFESDQHYCFRILRSTKNRFGGVNEIGVFEMTNGGLIEIPNPSELFLNHRGAEVSGTSIFAGVEGARPLLIEVQALLAPSNMPTPRRAVIGWDTNRLSMIIAVLAVRYKLNLINYEVYLTIAGGLKITEPAADLAVAAALISAALNKPMPRNSIFFGEISLSGEIRKVAQSELRIKEAKKLKFDTVVCPYNSAKDTINVINTTHVTELKKLI